MEERFISLLALERCESNIAQICALAHIAPDGREGETLQRQTKNIIHIAQNIARDIALLKDMTNNL